MVSVRMLLTARIIFSAAYPRGPPDSVVLTDWLSMTPAVTRLPASGFAHVHEQHVADGLPYPAVSPHIEIPLHRRVWREIFGQQTPLASGLGDVENGIDDIS